VKIIKAIYLLCISGALVIFFGSYPEWPFKGQIERIEIFYLSFLNKASATFSITEEKEIQRLHEATGLVWTQFGIVNSCEGDPSWMIEVYRANGEKERIYVDEDELGDCATPPKELVNLLKRKYSEPEAH